MLTLRPYQEEAVVSIFNYFASKSGNPIVALPTGTGKSLVIAEFIRRALHYYPGTRILCLTHVKELIDQNHKELLEAWPSAPAGIFSAGLRRKDTHLPVTFCGIASVHKSLEYFGRIDLVLIDECHLISDKSSTMYARAIGELQAINPCLKVIGLTATPFRAGMGLLTDGKLFHDLCVDYCSLDKFNLLVDQGYIAPLVPKRTATELDTEGVGMSNNGDFNMDELQTAVDKESNTRAAIEESIRLAANRKHWLIFCSGTDHADHTCNLLNALGISAVAVHTNLKGGENERDRSIRFFKQGLVRACVNVGVLTTGFNFKSIDCIVVLRPTMSTVLWIQLLGRGTRPDPDTGKVDCLVLDFAANTRRLGCINDPVIPKKKGKKGSAFVPYKICPVCDTYCHPRVRFCPTCQGEFPQHFAATTTAATEELIRKAPKEPKPPEPEAVVEEFDVFRVEYAKHLSKDLSKPPSMRVTYYCGSRTFNEWLCLEHNSGFARHKAREAWQLMGGDGHDSGDWQGPVTIDDALSQVDQLQPPNRIRVLMKGKWPEVVGYEFGAPGVALPVGIVRDDGAIANGNDIPF